MAQRVTFMIALYFFASGNHIGKYSLYSFYLFFWQNTGHKHGMVLFLYIVSYFHDIQFQGDHFWIIRQPCFANLKDKRGLKERQLGSEGYHNWSYMCFCFI